MIEPVTGYQAARGILAILPGRTLCLLRPQRAGRYQVCGYMMGPRHDYECWWHLRVAEYGQGEFYPTRAQAAQAANRKGISRC